MTELTPTTSQLAVLRRFRSFQLVNAKVLQPGDTVLLLEGREATGPTRHSVQVAADLHVDLPGDVAPFESLDTCQWRFLNHSCDPNCWFRGRELVARRRIQPWTEITFDYATTEWDMATPFRCRCGAAGCRGEVRGFRWLSSDAKRLVRNRAQPYLIDLDS